LNERVAIPILALAALCVFTAPLAAGSLDWTAAGALVAALLVLGAAQLLNWWAGGRRPRVSLSLGLLLGYAAMQAISMARTINLDASLKTLSLTLAGAVLVALFGSGSGGAEVPVKKKPPRDPAPQPIPARWDPALWVAAAVSAATLCVSVIGLRQYIANYGFAAGSRIFSTFFNPDITAGFLALALPVCLALLWLDLPRAIVPLVGITCVLGGAAFALTGSKGAWLAILPALVIMALARRTFVPPAERTTGPRFPIIAVFTGLAAAACSPLLLSRIASAQGAEAHSTEFRVLIWKSAIRMLLHRPFFGFGGGSFQQAYARFAIAGPTEMAHSAYLQAGAETGAIGLLLLILSAWYPIVRALRQSRQPARPDDSIYRALAPGLIAGLVASALHGLIDFDWSVVGLWIVFWAIAGASHRWMEEPAPASLRGAARAARPRGAPGLLAAGVLLALAAAAVAVTAAAAYEAGLASSALGLGSLTATTPDPDAAVALASTAIRLDPLDASSYLLRGEAQRSQAQGFGGGEAALAGAENDLRQAIRLQPRWAKPYYRLGRLQQAEGRNPAAAVSYRQALRRDPHALEAALYLAQLAKSRRQPDLARQWLQYVARAESTPYARIRGVPEDFDPNYLQAWVSLAKLDADAGSWSAAKTESQHALTDLDSYLSLAKQYVQLEQLWPIYGPEYRQSMAQVESDMTQILEQALTHLNQKSGIPAVRAHDNAFQTAIAAIKDPKWEDEGRRTEDMREARGARRQRQARRPAPLIAPRLVPRASRPFPEGNSRRAGKPYG